MSDFIIPKNRDFDFTLKVIENDSFLAQDLTNMSTATMTIIDASTQESMAVAVVLTVSDATNGIISGSIAAAETNKLNVSRGKVEDNYYLKDGYQASVNITFTDATLAINVFIESIYVSPTGA